MDGQLTIAERQALYQLIRSEKPLVVLEVGTWAGGGSTLQIVNALRENGRGTLHTCEIDKELFDYAKGGHQARELDHRHYRSDDGHIELYNTHSGSLILKLLQEGLVPDVIFLDGSEDPRETLGDLMALQPHLQPGAVVAVHDWELGHRIDGNRSTKCTLIRPYLESSSNWERLWALTAPVSVGLAAYRHLG
jgi:predicted O-methyltransferase YrrM